MGSAWHEKPLVRFCRSAHRPASGVRPRAGHARSSARNGTASSALGCAVGSTQLPAASLLADASLAPVAPPEAANLALNCDIVFASGGLLGLRLRTTSVDALGLARMLDESVAMPEGEVREHG